MAQRTRVGVIGCGFFAQNHLHSWRDLADQGVDLVAVCDLDGAKAKAASDQFGAPMWTDPAAMFAEANLDLVDIVTQVKSHNPLTRLAVGAGVAAIVQKPFGVDLADCRDMVAMADAAGLFLAVHENFRFQVPNRRVQELIQSGAIGTPNWARISFRTGYDVYTGQPYLLEEERLVVSDVGVHVLDLARVFLGEVEQVSAELQHRNPRPQGEDTATMMLRHTSGAVSVVECTYESRRLPDAFPDTMVEVEGSHGAIRVAPGPVVEVTSDGRMTSEDADAPLLDWAARPWHGIQLSVLQTCAHIHERFVAGQPADVSAADNLKTFALAEAAYEAAARGAAVSPQA